MVACTQAYKGKAMKVPKIVLGLAFFLLAVALSQPHLHAGEGIAATMAGPWEGNAHVIVNWCQRTNLPVALTIGADGAVTGTVGDATLTKARLKKNRGALGRRLNVKTDFIIVGDLQGAIVAREGITRSQVMMPLNFSGGKFVGGLHTSGSKFGGKDRGILSAGLTLNRPIKP